MPDESVTQPTPRSSPKAGGKRQRRNSSSARVALALVETHLRGVYQQMELLTKAIAELKSQLG